MFAKSSRKTQNYGFFSHVFSVARDCSSFIRLIVITPSVGALRSIERCSPNSPHICLVTAVILGKLVKERLSVDFLLLVYHVLGWPSEVGEKAYNILDERGLLEGGKKVKSRESLLKNYIWVCISLKDETLATRAYFKCCFFKTFAITWYSVQSFNVSSLSEYWYHLSLLLTEVESLGFRIVKKPTGVSLCRYMSVFVVCETGRGEW